MKYVILEGPTGRRLIGSGVPYRMLPGERRVGVTGSNYNFKICSQCKEKGVFEYT
ncbi:hypothetical protein LCGC14_2548350 [marine sediment metagenome]|uniref:Uncharacterized protein n=1 Tax=marine sediment metagenome TaxID=412755 RepID=A0A0F9AP53_9ZZZZ